VHGPLLLYTLIFHYVYLAIGHCFDGNQRAQQGKVVFQLERTPVLCLSHHEYWSDVCVDYYIKEVLRNAEYIGHARECSQILEDHVIRADDVVPDSFRLAYNRHHNARDSSRTMGAILYNLRHSILDLW